MFLHPVDDFIEAQRRAVEVDRIGGRRHRRDVAGGIAGVALLLLSERFLERDRRPASLQLFQTAPGPLAGLGMQEELALGIRKDDRSLIAPLADDVSPRRDPPLLLD